MANIDNTPTGNPALFNTQIPDLDDNANIQTALRLYHYGSETIPASNAAILDTSIAGYLKAVNTQLTLIQSSNVSSITSLGNNANLNNLITAGRWSQDNDNDAQAANSLNYPRYSTREDGTQGIAYAGLLTVVVAENIVYQTYQMTNIVPNAFFFRTRSALEVWSPWERIANYLHNHDGRYYSRTDIDGLLKTTNDNVAGKQNTITGAAETVTTTNLSNNVVVVSSGTGKIASSTITTTNLGLLSNAVDTAGKTNSSPNGTVPRLVFSNAPSFTGFPSANAENNATVPVRSTTSNTLVTQAIMARDAITSKTSTVNNAGIFIQQAQPSNATVNDLWIW